MFHGIDCRNCCHSFSTCQFVASFFYFWECFDSYQSLYYCTYVGPLLEYCSYLWSPYQNYLIDKIECVQRYFSRRVLFLTKPPYLTRLEILKLETLEMRRIKFDLKLCYKIINGLRDLNFDEFFMFTSSSVTRGHNNYKLIKPFSKNNWLLNFYSSRIV